MNDESGKRAVRRGHTGGRRRGGEERRWIGFRAGGGETGLLRVVLVGQREQATR